MDVEEFISRWSTATISERSHYQTFISQLCALIGVPAPDEERVGDLDYCFERPVRFVHEDGSSQSGAIDCYRRGAFVLEAKQSRKRGAGGDLDPLPHLALLAGRGRKRVQPCGGALERIMLNAKRQAENYAKALDEWPPFIVVVDVGRSIDLWADFNRQGKGYAPFPDRARYRIGMNDLRDAAVRQRLRSVWADAMSLDPAAHVAEVTTDIAERLAWLVRSISSRIPKDENGRADPVAKAARASRTALFIMQCIFAMFADSVNLIEKRGFLRFLESYRGAADRFHLGADDFFRRMDQGGHCAAIRQDLKRFNGGLFQHSAALPITEAELEALIAAAQRDWASVEPAIFGALLEQALDPAERVELGAHYTPKAYVRRLVEATVMEPLRADWEAHEADALGAYLRGEVLGARGIVRQFHTTLCKTQVLDPACGTGNFLYVAMDMMKDLESEILTSLADLGEGQAALGLDGHTVTPEQFWGLEKNEYAVWIAEMVMWIGYLQWHFRTWRNAMPSEPILRNFHRIHQVDALITSDREEIRRDAVGRPLTRVRTMRRGPAGVDPLGPRHEEREVVRLIDPRPTAWPAADFIIGNPPFIGGKDLRAELGDGYVDALWQVRQGRFRSADLVAAWWDRAAEILTAKGSRLRRFGFITTNSINQTFSRRVLEHHLNGEPPMRLTFAIPDHPWIKGVGRADVRIAMTVAERGRPDGQGRLLTVIEEREAEAETPDIVFRERRGVIGPDLTLGLSLNAPKALKANALLCSAGVKLHGAGFIVSEERAAMLLAASDEEAGRPIFAYRNGRDLASRPRDARVIDLFGWSEREARLRHPAVFQHLLETVKPERDLNNRQSYRDNWWIFGEPRSEFRPALEGLSRYIATVETAKHRWFRFLEADVLPDNAVIAIASDDPRVLGVLSSRVHGLWALARGGRLEDRPTYTKTACFDAFPFPELDGWIGEETGVLAKEIDDLRQDVLARHDDLTMTGLYNLRQRLIVGADFSAAERDQYERGHVHLLHHLHQRLDDMVLTAYGWDGGMGDDAMLGALMALNRARREEEMRGVIRFLRPAYQQGRVKVSVRAVQTEVSLDRPIVREAWPGTPAALAGALLEHLRREGGPLRPVELARRFSDRPGRRMTDRIEQTLAVLAVAGSVRRTDDGWFSPRRV
ncbi:type II restriction endonuclease subunit M [Brevundimonas naejangsanensis]|uniref:site-specific DNA-methyltransferase (adenine-specific) n=1 Tax=Brevundimonas naejangsanensis TaxID=588932 RepID=A0A494RNX9_9CAUL|nr:DNA methyltransferase [Brevundimonas naejangsanensis]AYG95742.1 type II restriction endonuclease subunit M [Brevundimonas naejangsanensis]